jgi:hypothetical protein
MVVTWRRLVVVVTWLAGWVTVVTSRLMVVTWRRLVVVVTWLAGWVAIAVVRGGEVTWWSLLVVVDGRRHLVGRRRVGGRCCLMLMLVMFV